MKNPNRTEHSDKQLVNRALFLLALRIALIFIFSIITWLFLKLLVNDTVKFPPGMLYATISLFPVNLICLTVVKRMLKSEGESLTDILKPRKNKLFMELLQGIGWQFVLFIPFIATIMLSAWFLFGNQMFQAFETIFYSSENEIVLKPIILVILGVITVITFAPINAPTEELIFRGYVQTRLSKKLSVSLAIVLSSVVFGLQHIFFARSFYGAIIYFFAFTSWGIGSGIIVHFQNRLFPVVVAHFLVNLISTLPTIIFPILMLMGIIEF